MEKVRSSRIVGMRQHGAWTRWEGLEVTEQKVSLVWKAEPLRFKFLIQSVYDVLPSPAKL